MTKIITLTRGQVTQIDDWNFEEINQYKWQAQWDASIQSYYATRHARGKTIFMHREIAKTVKGMICDHWNHDTLDNREKNLRNVTHSQSQMNKFAQSNNRLGEKGISPNGNSFRVLVRMDKKTVFNKTFKKLSDAIIARDAAVRKIHGEFGYLNFPTEDDKMS